MRSALNICEEFKNIATASLLENWIDGAERRTWFLHKIVHDHKL
jgi:starvation-inducible DNA-binding protein